MKKVLSKLKEHTAHHEHDRDHTHDHDGLKASLYDETVSKSPPTIGERPIKGDLHHLDSSRAVDAPSRTSGRHDQPSKIPGNNPFDDARAGLAMPSGGQPMDQRHDGYQLPPQDQGMPTNFSRLSLGKSDGL